MQEDVPQLLELRQIRDDFSTGCGKVEIVGSCARFYFYADQDCLGAGGRERVLVSKLVMPIDFIPTALQVMTLAISGSGPQNTLAREILLAARFQSH